MMDSRDPKAFLSPDTATEETTTTNNKGLVRVGAYYVYDKTIKNPDDDMEKYTSLERREDVPAKDDPYFNDFVDSTNIKHRPIFDPATGFAPPPPSNNPFNPDEYEWGPIPGTKTKEVGWFKIQVNDYALGKDKELFQVHVHEAELRCRSVLHFLKDCGVHAIRLCTISPQSQHVIKIEAMISPDDKELFLDMFGYIPDFTRHETINDSLLTYERTHYASEPFDENSEEFLLSTERLSEISDLRRMSGSFSSFKKLASENGLTGTPTPPPVTSWIIPKMLPTKTLVLFAGEKKKGKSALMLQLAMACAVGKNWLGFDVPKCEGLIIYVSGEDRRQTAIQRAHKMLSKKRLPASLYIVEPQSMSDLKEILNDLQENGDMVSLLIRF